MKGIKHYIPFRQWSRSLFILMKIQTAYFGNCSNTKISRMSKVHKCSMFSGVSSFIGGPISCMVNAMKNVRPLSSAHMALFEPIQEYCFRDNSCAHYAANLSKNHCVNQLHNTSKSNCILICMIRSYFNAIRISASAAAIRGVASTPNGYSGKTAKGLVVALKISVIRI